MNNPEFNKDSQISKEKIPEQIKESLEVTEEMVELLKENIVMEFEKIEDSFLEQDKKVFEVPVTLGLDEQVVQNVKNEMNIEEKISDLNIEEKNSKDFFLQKIKNIGTRIRAKIVERSITPIGYDPLKPLSMPGELLLPKLEAKTWAVKNRYDAWSIYNGLPQKFDAFTKNKDGTYKINSYSLDVEDIEKILNDPRDRLDIDINFGGVSGGSMVSKESDERGTFMKFTDLWNLQPIKGFKILPEAVREFEVSTLSGGKPFETVNKVYYDNDRNFFDDDGTLLVKVTESVTYPVNKGSETKDVTFYRTKDIENTKQNDVLNEWDKHSSYGFMKSMMAPALAMAMLFGYAEKDRKKIQEKTIEYAKQKGITTDSAYNYLGEHPDEFESVMNNNNIK